MTALLDAYLRGIGLTAGVMTMFGFVALAFKIVSLTVTVTP